MSDGWQLLVVTIVMMVLQSVKDGFYGKFVGRKNGKLFKSLSVGWLFLLFIWWQGGDVFLLSLWLALLVLEFGVKRLERDFQSVENDVQEGGWLGLKNDREVEAHDLLQSRKTEGLGDRRDDLGAAGSNWATKVVVRCAWWAEGMAFACHFMELGIIAVMWSRVGFDFSWILRGDVLGTKVFIQLLFFYVVSESCLLLYNRFYWFWWRRKLIREGWDEGTSTERLLRFSAAKPRNLWQISTIWLFLVSLLELVPIYPLFIYFVIYSGLNLMQQGLTKGRSQVYHQMWWPDEVAIELASTMMLSKQNHAVFNLIYAWRIGWLNTLAWFVSVPALSLLSKLRRNYLLIKSEVALRKRFKATQEVRRQKIIVISEFVRRVWIDARFGPLWNNLKERQFAWWTTGAVTDSLYSNGPFAYLSHQYDGTGHVALMIPKVDEDESIDARTLMKVGILHRFWEIVHVPLTILDVWELEDKGAVHQLLYSEKDVLVQLEYIFRVYDEGVLEYSDDAFMESFVGPAIELNDRLQVRLKVLYRDLNGWRYDGGVFDLNVLHRRVHEFPEAASRFLELLNVWELVARWMVIVEGVEEYEQEEETLRISFGKTCADVRKTAFMQAKLGVPADGKLMEEVREYWKEAFNWTASMSQNPTVEEAFGWMVYIRNKTRGHGSTSRIKEELYIVVEALTFLLLDRLKDHADLEIMVRDVKEDGTVFFTCRHGMRLDFIEAEDSSVSTLVGAESDVHFRKVGQEDWRTSNLLKAEKGHVFLLNEIRKGHREWVCFSTGELIRPASIFDA